MIKFTLGLEWMILFTGLAGAFHVLGPDHWLPTSVIAWQKRWKTSQTVLFSILAFFAHVLTGYLLFLLFQSVLGQLGLSDPFLIAAVLVLVMNLIRGFRFPRIQDVFQSGNKGVWGSFVAFSLLGPCEVVLPIFIKSKQMGIGYLIPFCAFLAGTWVAGVCLVLGGKSLWSRPFWLPWSLRWALERRALLPVLAGFCLSLGFWLI